MYKYPCNFQLDMFLFSNFLTFCSSLLIVCLFGFFQFVVCFRTLILSKQERFSCFSFDCFQFAWANDKILVFSFDRFIYFLFVARTSMVFVFVFLFPGDFYKWVFFFQSFMLYSG
ncbi:hypothetical protein PRUPE_2G277100 [Prunus persica]|uniref:Uncharacterized protein n=1 Tax=Prunus persica TaxID=3760 RepID=A0A251QML9_PRUPE|nr:hypothetical protein PRUPE_2G277100 [Prunus persica]